MKNYDVIVVGGGVGGSIIARRLAERGARVLIVERGDFVPCEPDNWSVGRSFPKKYKAKDTWIDRHVADGTVDGELVATDLPGQAEHGAREAMRSTFRSRRCGLDYQERCARLMK